MFFIRRQLWLSASLAIASLLAASLPCAVRSQTAAPAPPPILLGTAWYPEQWPESRWDADLTLMQQAGIHMVRIGEFAWSRMEPSEGQYDLDWLDHAITAAAKHNIYTVLGTPTPTPPAWMTQKYPEIRRMYEDGRLAEHGNRQHFNFDNPKNRRANGQALRTQSLGARLADRQRIRRRNLRSRYQGAVPAVAESPLRNSRQFECSMDHGI